MSNKVKVAIGVVLLAAAFAAGRYASPTKVVTKTVEVEKKTSDTDRNKHKETTTVERTNPDGTKEVVTKTVEDTNTTKRTTTDSTTSAESETTYSRTRVNISAMYGVDLSSPLKPEPHYGGAVTSSVLGPVTLGVFFLTPGIVGASVGLNF